MRDDLLAFHQHVDEVVSHIEDCVRAIDQDVFGVEKALEVV